jgi:hypothetical protein
LLYILFPVLALGELRRQFSRCQALAELRQAWQREREGERRSAHAAFRSYAGYDAVSWEGNCGFERRVEMPGARLDGRVVSTGEGPESLVMIEPFAEGRDAACLILDSGGGGSASLITGIAATLFRDHLRRAESGARDFPVYAFMAALESALERIGKGNLMATGLAGSYSIRGGHLSLLPFGVDKIVLARADGTSSSLELPPSLPANAFGGAMRPSPRERSLFNSALEPGDSILAYAGEAPWWRSDAENLWRDMRARDALASPALHAAAALTLPALRGVDWSEDDSAWSLPERRIAIDEELVAMMASLAPFPLEPRTGVRSDDGDGFVSLRAGQLRPFRLDCAVLTIENKGFELAASNKGHPGL